MNINERRVRVSCRRLSAGSGRQTDAVFTEL